MRELDNIPFIQLTKEGNKDALPLSLNGISGCRRGKWSRKLLCLFVVNHPSDFACFAQALAEWDQGSDGLNSWSTTLLGRMG